jgi:hypothetical protein
VLDPGVELFAAPVPAGEADAYSWMRESRAGDPAGQSVSGRRDGHSYFTRTVPGREFEQFPLEDPSLRPPRAAVAPAREAACLLT